MKDTLLVSIITPVYNCSDFIAETIESVIAQTYINWELLIIDDCSTDNSYEIVQSYAAIENRIRVIKNANNSGQAFSRNNGIKQAKGVFIALLDSDDLWHTQKLETHVRYSLDNDITFTYSDFELIDEAGKKIKVMYPPSKLSFNLFLMYNPIGCLTIFYNKNKVGNLLFEEHKDYQSVEDNIFCAELINKVNGLTYYKIPQVLAYYRVRNNSSSARKMGMFKKRIKMLRNYFKINSAKCFLFLTIYFLRNSIKYSKIKLLQSFK